MRDRSIAARAVHRNASEPIWIAARGADFEPTRSRGKYPAHGQLSHGIDPLELKPKGGHSLDMLKILIDKRPRVVSFLG